MSGLLRLLIRVSAFVRKEIVEILRQPRLILTLVLGPFLILLLFGIGFQNKPRVLRTIFVVEPDSPLVREIDRFRDLGPQLDLLGTNSDRATVEESLRDQDIDLMVVAPPDAYETIRAGDQATFTLYHNEVDPFQIDYVNVFGRVYIDEVNRRILQTITDRGQDEALSARQHLANARTEAEAMRRALEAGDVATARAHQSEMNRSLDGMEQTVGTSLNLLEGVEETLGSGEATDTSAIRRSLSASREATLAMGTIQEGERAADIAQARVVEARLAEVDDQLGEFEPIDSLVLVSPFRTETASIAPIQPQVAQYYAPAVIVLLLQHLAVTFAALSIVREAAIGALELFRVSPVSTGETLLGKYISYLLIGGVLATILTTILVSNYAIPLPAAQSLLEGNLVIGLGVPMLGRWLDYALVVGGLLFAALGVGFIISTIVETDSQAVQYAMIVLLTSVFFSGFFLSIQTLWEPVRAVSWALPATYAILLLQDIMLRGRISDPFLLASLWGMGAALYLVALILFHRTMHRA